MARLSLVRLAAVGLVLSAMSVMTPSAQAIPLDRIFNGVFGGEREEAVSVEEARFDFGQLPPNVRYEDLQIITTEYRGETVAIGVFRGNGGAVQVFASATNPAPQLQLQNNVVRLTIAGTTILIHNINDGTTRRVVSGQVVNEVLTPPNQQPAISVE
jgi:hypothetical protein